MYMQEPLFVKFLFNIIVLLLSFVVTMIYVRKYFIVNQLAKPLVAGIVIVTSAYAIYHGYWAMLFYAEMIKDTDLFEFLFEYRWITWFIGGTLILVGYIKQLCFFIRPIFPGISMTKAMSLLVILTAIFFGLLQIPGLHPDTTIFTTYSESLQQYLSGPHLLATATIAGHTSIGILSLIVSVFCFGYFFFGSKTQQDIRGFALAIAYISFGCVFYRLHWATGTYQLGINHRDVYAFLFNYWPYMSVVLTLTIAGFGLHIKYAFKKINKVATEVIQ